MIHASEAWAYAPATGFVKKRGHIYPAEYLTLKQVKLPPNDTEGRKFLAVLFLPKALSLEDTVC